MPLDHSGSCQGFKSNMAHLVKKFESEGYAPEEAKKRAVAAAARIMKDAGGNPATCASGG